MTSAIRFRHGRRDRTAIMSTAHILIAPIIALMTSHMVTPRTNPPRQNSMLRGSKGQGKALTEKSPKRHLQPLTKRNNRKLS